MPLNPPSRPPAAAIQRPAALQQAGSRIGWAEFVMSSVLLLQILGFAIHIGRLSFYFGPYGRTAAIGIELVMIAIGAVACVMLRLYWALLVGGLILAYIAFQVLLFANNFHTDVHWAPQSGYLGWLALLVYAPALRILPPKRIIDIFFGVAIVYAIVYIMISLRVPGFEPPRTNEELLALQSDAAIGRPSRFVMLSSLVAFAFYVCLTRIFREGRWMYLPLLALFLTCVWVSYARTITLMIAIVAILYVLTRSVRLIGWVALSIFVLGSATLIAGLLLPEFYPFDVFGAHDLSAVARSNAYEIVRSFMAEHWFLGVGFASGADQTTDLVSYGWFYAMDLGPVGVLFEAGAVGVALFFFFALVSSLPGNRFTRLGFEQPDDETLVLTGCACTMMGVLWPELWNLTGSMFTGLFLAALTTRQTTMSREALVRRRQSSRPPPPTRST